MDNTLFLFQVMYNFYQEMDKSSMGGFVEMLENYQWKRLT